jgi:serine phosphatase RsbU (regulator of sigma subunit)
MMGILRGANFPVNSCLVPSGARLLIFSDGVFEMSIIEARFDHDTSKKAQ